MIRRSLSTLSLLALAAAPLAAQGANDPTHKVEGGALPAGWQAVATHVRPDGMVDGTCVGTTAAYDAVYYYNRPTDPEAMQGFGPVLMAGSEVITMLRSFDVERRLNTFHYRAPKR
jgi:hypothetical protein